MTNKQKILALFKAKKAAEESLKASIKSLEASIKSRDRTKENYIN
jgi:hypothetical protein